MHILETHEDPDDDDAMEHSPYTPQTDIDYIPSGTIIMG